MDEKTESLRDIFMSVSDTETVTESQADERGSLARAEDDVDERLRDVIERMRERFSFETDLADETRCRIVRGFYDGRSDENLAAELDLSEDEVVRARADLHLLREADLAAPDLDRVADLRAAGATRAEITEALSLPREGVERLLAILQARDRSRRVSRRFTTEFEEVLTDADLSVRLTAAMDEDGLREAAEDIETDVEF